ncbi:MAG: class I SAM-dependent methyltransferase [Verrucomicrobiota bacterium]
MKPSDLSRISSRYARFPDRCYVTCKLRTDPLYAAVSRELEGSTLPLLDVGCGLGLLALYLYEAGHRFPAHGLDYDRRKISTAIAAAGDEAFDFREHDARRGLPAFSGNVTILDILQFFQPAEQETLLRQAADRLAPGGKLILRSGLRDRSVRFHVTHAADVIAKVTRWMKAAPVHYPDAEFLRSVLAPYGTLTLSPLWGHTPFNNHLIVLQRPPAPQFDA